LDALSDYRFKKNFFIEGHFILFELGFSPLTLLCATFDDFKKARRRYYGISHVIEFSIVRLALVINEEAKTRHSDCILLRKQVYAQCEMLKLENFDAHLENPVMQQFLVGLCE
jgi:hypothetical protein